MSQNQLRVVAVSNDGTRARLNQARSHISEYASLIDFQPQRISLTLTFGSVLSLAHAFGICYKHDFGILSSLWQAASELGSFAQREFPTHTPLPQLRDIKARLKRHCRSPLLKLLLGGIDQDDLATTPVSDIGMFIYNSLISNKIQASPRFADAPVVLTLGTEDDSLFCVDVIDYHSRLVNGTILRMYDGTVLKTHQDYVSLNDGDRLELLGAICFAALCTPLEFGVDNDSDSYLVSVQIQRAIPDSTRLEVVQSTQLQNDQFGAIVQRWDADVSVLGVHGLVFLLLSTLQGSLIQMYNSADVSV
jgi:hypothetical protein